MSQRSRALRYAIIGTGAIGGYYGARLQHAGCEVHFLLNSDYEWVKAHGLKVASTQGDFELKTVNAYCDAAKMPEVDVAIVALKTTQNEQLSKLLPSTATDGAVLSLQNGYDVERDIATHLEENNVTVENIIGGLCFIGVNKVAPGHVVHTDYGHIVLGAYEETGKRCTPTPLIRAIAADFARASVEAQATDDLPMARWKKLVWNVPYNGLSVVLNATTDRMMADSGVRSLITTLMTEVVTTANAWGEQVSPGSSRQISPNIVEDMLAHTENMGAYETSMKLDYARGRSLEIEAILGNPMRTANAIGLSVPAIAMLYQQLNFLNKTKVAYTASLEEKTSNEIDFTGSS